MFQKVLQGLVMLLDQGVLVDEGLRESSRVCWVNLFGPVILLRRVEQGNPRADSDGETGMK